MVRLQRLFRKSGRPVLSFGVYAEAAPARLQGQFEVLVRHLLFRLFHNELLASDDETKRVMLISYTAALPSLLVTLFLFPAYHAFPPAPYPRPFWPQACDHYFYVTYSMVVMGLAAVYEWDMLFPDILDVFVLSVLPISNLRLFTARVLALTIFFVLVLLGTSVLGIVFFPAIAELPHPLLHTFAHAVAVLGSGTLACASFLALQGILLNIVGETIARRAAPFLQSASLMVLLTVLLLFPMLSHELKNLMLAGSPFARLFPPFWFLGMYEWILGGRGTLPIFKHLAVTGCWVTGCMILCSLVTYPLAYRRRVRHLVEGSAVANSRDPARGAIRRLLDRKVVRQPGARAIFHFINQTVLRVQRHRVTLAMYTGVALSIMLSGMLVLRVEQGHTRVLLTPYGVRAAIPTAVFWSVAALRTTITSPVDLRGAWLFPSIVGRAQGEHMAGSRSWVTLWSVLLSTFTAVVLFFLGPPEIHAPRVFVDQILVGAGLSLVLADVFLYSVRAIPFTRIRISAATDVPLAVIKYAVLFPALVALTVRLERWIEAGNLHLIETILSILALHLLLRRFHARSLEKDLDDDVEHVEIFPQGLGLWDS